MPYSWISLASACVLTLSLLTQYPPDPAVPSHPDGGTPASGAASRPATQPTTAPAGSFLPAGTLNPSDDAVLETALAAGYRIKVQGTVASSAWSRSGSTLRIVFNDPTGKPIAREKGVVGILLQNNKETFDKAFGGDFAKALEGKKIELDGKLTVYRGRDNTGVPSKQIMLEDTAQVKILN